MRPSVMSMIEILLCLASPPDGFNPGKSSNLWLAFLASSFSGSELTFVASYGFASADCSSSFETPMLMHSLLFFAASLSFLIPWMHHGTSILSKPLETVSSLSALSSSSFSTSLHLWSNHLTHSDFSQSLFTYKTLQLWWCVVLTLGYLALLVKNWLSIFELGKVRAVNFI